MSGWFYRLHPSGREVRDNYIHEWETLELACGHPDIVHRLYPLSGPSPRMEQAYEAVKATGRCQACEKEGQ